MQPAATNATPIVQENVTENDDEEEEEEAEKDNVIAQNESRPLLTPQVFYLGGSRFNSQCK